MAKKQSKASPKYPPEVLKPLPRPIGLLDWHRHTKGPNALALQMGIAAEALERLGALLDHYKIERNPETQWLMLSLHLASEYVFKYEEPRKLKWGRWEHLRLWAEVKSREDTGEKITTICKDLVKQDRYRPKKGIPWGKTLEKQYYESVKSPLVQLVNNKLGVSAAQALQALKEAEQETTSSINAI